MPQANHILVPIEIHENAAPVVAWAALIARAMHSRLTLLHEEKDVDLIVMATHGRSGVQRLVLGSVTEKVVRAAACPVLAVRSE